jgi:hypothetical protein
MSGMNTTLSPTNLSDYQGRIALIKVKGVFLGNNGMGNNSDTIKVPFHRLSQTLQKIRRAGIPVESVTFTSSSHQETESKLIDVSDHSVSLPAKNQQTPIPEIDSDEYAADIGGDMTTMELLPGLGVKFTKTIQNPKSKI